MEQKTGYWHGNDATILKEDGKNLTILVGSFTKEEIEEAKKFIDEDACCKYEEYTACESKYEEYIAYCDIDEWNEQQN